VHVQTRIKLRLALIAGKEREMRVAVAAPPIERYRLTGAIVRQMVRHRHLPMSQSV
jgi:hypothetical protein